MSESNNWNSAFGACPTKIDRRWRRYLEETWIWEIKSLTKYEYFTSTFFVKLHSIFLSDERIAERRRRPLDRHRRPPGMQVYLGYVQKLKLRGRRGCAIKFLEIPSIDVCSLDARTLQTTVSIWQTVYATIEPSSNSSPPFWTRRYWKSSRHSVISLWPLGNRSSVWYPS